MVEVIRFMPPCPECRSSEHVRAVQPNGPTSSYGWYYVCSNRIDHARTERWEGDEVIRRNIHFRTRADREPLTSVG